MQEDRSNCALDILKQFSDHLNQINEADPNQEPFYELMSGALVWRDETTSDTPSDVISALRFVWAYRTSLMLDEPRTEFAELWARTQEMFPNWIGFLPARRCADPKFLEVFRQGDVGMRACLRKINQTDE